MGEREEMARIAQALANVSARYLHRGSRVVVLVTGEGGEWVGVGSNTTPEDTDASLHSAIEAEGRIYYAPKVHRG